MYASNFRHKDQCLSCQRYAALDATLVVDAHLSLNGHRGLGQHAEPLAIFQFVAQFPVEIFDEALLPGRASCDDDRDGSFAAHKVRHGDSCEVCPVGAAYVLGLAEGLYEL